MKLTMARSDSEDVYEVTDAGPPALGGGSLGGGGGGLLLLAKLEVDDAVLDKPNDTTIHSGHFMVSHVHDDEPPDEGGVEKDSPTLCLDGAGPLRMGIDVEVVPPSGRSVVRGAIGGPATPGGSRSASSLFIDGSLRKLFDCMSLAHCNKLTSPKWKNFKGVNVRLKDKIRLNNIIWREWHMQYIKGMSPIVCHFETLISGKNDGTLDYWKLRLDSLTRDYKRLSRIFAHRFSIQPDDHELLTRLPSSYYELLQGGSSSNAPQMANPSLITVPTFSAGEIVTMDDEAIKDIFDTLFTPFPSSRGNSCNFNTQTSLEEFMDTLEPLPPPLAIDFRGIGRSSNSMMGVDNSVILNDSMENVTNQYNSASSMPPPPQQPAMPTECSQTLSFGSAEELLALLQSQLASETSLECLISDPSSAAISSSGYSGTNIPSGFAISDDNLVASDGASISLFSDGIDMQEYTGSGGGNGAAGQLCGMFFLPEATSLPVPSMSVYAPVGELPDSGATACREQSMQLGSSAVGNRVQLHSFLQDAARMAFPAGTKRPPQGSLSLPKMRSSHNLETVERGSRSLGSLQANDGGTRGFSNSRSSNDPLTKLSPKGFRTPQSTRHLPPLQPRPPNTCPTAYQQQEGAHVKQQGTSLLLPKQPIQPSVSTGDWSIMMTTGGSHLTLPLVKQFAISQDVQPSSDYTTQGNSSLMETKHRVRHKSDQSSAAKGTTIRPIAVFQPINPLQTDSSSGRTSSKTNCSVTFSLDKNTTLDDLSVLQVHSLANSIIISGPGNSVAFAGSSQPSDDTQKGAFGEIRSCPGIFETSFHLGDFSDSVSLNSSSARSRHTSNESNRSTSSHYDDVQFGVKNSRPKNEARKQTKELRRVSHITAEQKRRCNIKCGFDTLISLIPDLKESANSRVSKATALHKAIDLCKKMKQERKDELQEMEQLRNEIKALEADISACQSQLPASGAAPIKQPMEQLNQHYKEYFCKRTLENWKFFIFGTIIAQPLLKSFDEEVTRGSLEQLRKSVLSWIQTHCSLASLRPRVTNAMVELTKQTSILSNPSLVPEEVKMSVLWQRSSYR